MHERAMLLLLLPSLLVAACTWGAPPAGGGAQGLLPSVQARSANGVVEFTLQVTNATDAAVELQFSSGQSYDFRVMEGEREVWRWSSDQMFTQALRTETLPAGETLTFTEQWRPEAGRSGEFVVVATLTATDRRVEQSAHFRIP